MTKQLIEGEGGREVLQKEDILTVEEASELLRVSVNSIRASLARGQLPGAKVGREWRLSRQALANWLVSPENPYFAKAMVNRLWKAMFGHGLVEPVITWLTGFSNSIESWTAPIGKLHSLLPRPLRSVHLKPVKSEQVFVPVVAAGASFFCPCLQGSMPQPGLTGA